VTGREEKEGNFKNHPYCIRFYALSTRGVFVYPTLAPLLPWTPNDTDTSLAYYTP
jgi:hypothetical protein